MKAALIRRHGDASVIELGELPEPSPGAGEVLVRTRASALNHLDIWVRQGLPGLKLAFPHVLGSDGAGVVESVGAGVTRVKAGDEVLLHPGLSCGKCETCLTGTESLCREYKILGEQVGGTLADRLCLPEANCFPKPKRLSFAEGAALPLVFITAWEMLAIKGRVRKGDRVLIHAAGSGVSSAAIQIARAHGAEIFATSSTTEKLERARRLGAHHLINYRTQDVVVEVKKLAKGGLDIIIDHVGKTTWEGNIKCLKSGGTLVICGATTGGEAMTPLGHVFFRQLRLLGSTMGSKRDFPAILSHVESGQLEPVVDRIFPFEAAAEAHRYLESASQFGKVVVEVSP